MARDYQQGTHKSENKLEKKNKSEKKNKKEGAASTQETKIVEQKATKQVEEKKGQNQVTQERSENNGNLAFGRIWDYIEHILVFPLIT